MNPFTLNQEPRWYRWVDGLVILSIGFVIGILVSVAMPLREVETTRVIRNVQLKQPNQNESVEGTVDAPLNTPSIRFDEI